MASKGYTISFFINEIQSKVGHNSNVASLVDAISPVYGADSVKINTLSSFVGNFNAVASGTGKYAGLGKTPRARLLKALKLRKKHGFVA